MSEQQNDLKIEIARQKYPKVHIFYKERILNLAGMHIVISENLL